MRRFVLALLVACPVLTSAQAPAPPPPADAAAAALPVRRVILYKTGVGYFEHLGNVRNRQAVTIRFTSSQLNDVLNSLTAIDLGKGQITGISYNSVAPLDQRLGALRLPLDERTTALQVLGSLRGARVEVTGGGAPVQGRLLSVEQHSRQQGANTVTVETFSVLTDAGGLRTFELSPAVHIRVVERDLRQEIGRYLDLVGSTREQDVRSMVISTSGAGERPLFVSYISEVPIWKSTYRLVLPSSGKPLLQGWAIVDNTIGEDWQGVELSLVAGAPQSFIQNISQPYYGRRPVVPLPTLGMLAPQTHQATLSQAARMDALQESVTVNAFATAPSPPAAAASPGRVATGRGAGVGSGGGTGGGVPGGVVGGMVGGLPNAPADAYERARQLDPRATAASLGDLFEYRIKEPISLKKNQSALVPIANAEIEAEKVSLWNRTAGSGRPLRALWLKNTTPLTLDGGSISIVDANAFAGEGLIEPLKPGERRLLSYAADLGMLVDARMQGDPVRISRLRARDGIIIQETQQRTTWTYKARNENASQATLIVEHPVRPGWKLAPGQTPVESTAGAERFRVPIEAGKEATLEVREIRQDEARISIGVVDDALIAQLAQSGVSAAALEQALKPVLEKKAQLSVLEQQLQSLESERTGIVQDQQRLRENMKALRGSAEEKELLRRYTRQLDEQETRLDKLGRDITQATAARDRGRAELATAIQSVSFDLGAGAGS